MGTKGSLVKYDEGTILKTRLDEAIVCILTKIMGRVEETLIVKINDQPFNIYILEVDEQRTPIVLPASWSDEDGTICTSEKDSLPAMEEVGDMMGEEDMDGTEGGGGVNGNVMREQTVESGDTIDLAYKKGEVRAKCLKGSVVLHEKGHGEVFKTSILEPTINVEEVGGSQPINVEEVCGSQSSEE